MYTNIKMFKFYQNLPGNTIYICGYTCTCILMFAWLKGVMQNRKVCHGPKIYPFCVGNAVRFNELQISACRPNFWYLHSPRTSFKTKECIFNRISIIDFMRKQRVWLKHSKCMCTRHLKRINMLVHNRIICYEQLFVMYAKCLFMNKIDFRQKSSQCAHFALFLLGS